MMHAPEALDVLYHHAARNCSPHTALHIARLALVHARESHSEPIVTLAKNIVHALETDAWSTITQSNPRIPPKVNIPKLLSIIPTFHEWGVPIPQGVVTMALHDAITYEEPLETIQCLLDAGADANAILDITYFSPLMKAARKGRADIVSMLLRAGANKECIVDGHSALSLATEPAVVSLLM